jgi:hypothetical protein
VLRLVPVSETKVSRRWAAATNCYCTLNSELGIAVDMDAVETLLLRLLCIDKHNLFGQQLARPWGADDGTGATGAAALRERLYVC